MTTYLRAFTEAHLQTLRDLVQKAGPGPDDALASADQALTTPVNGEALAMPIVCAGWNDRAAALELPKKGVKREQDRAAYMQGAMTALVACGLMTIERANQIGFLLMVGRLEEYMAEHAKKEQA